MYRQSNDPAEGRSWGYQQSGDRKKGASWIKFHGRANGMANGDSEERALGATIAGYRG